MTRIIDPQDCRSGVAVKLLAHLEERLAETRRDNDHPMAPEATALIRGRIAELKHLLDLLATGES